MGCLAGVMSGMLGVGGGIILVPAFIWLLHTLEFSPDQLTHYAVATSLATIVITSAASTRAHHRRSNVAWPSVLRLSSGILIGGWLAGMASIYIPSDMLARIFSLFLIWGACAMWINRDVAKATGGEEKSVVQSVPSVELAVAGGGIGFLSTLLGIGGGTIMVPYLHFRGFAMTRAVGSAAMCGLVIAFSGSIGFLFAGWSLPSKEWTVGFVYLPLAIGVCLTSFWFAPIGAWLAERLPTILVKRGFAVLMLGVAVQLFLS